MCRLLNSCRSYELAAYNFRVYSCDGKTTSSYLLINKPSRPTGLATWTPPFKPQILHKSPHPYLAFSLVQFIYIFVKIRSKT